LEDAKVSDKTHALTTACKSFEAAPAAQMISSGLEPHQAANLVSPGNLVCLRFNEIADDG